ncbi:MAG TPA: cysteine hydrolase family protein [Ilumatobacter sp.]|nr:cysteine hydrolase family protein [Ilumatobacter sp.]
MTATQRSSRTVANSTPYPWPYDEVIDPAVTALVVCGGGDTWSAGVRSDPPTQARIALLRAAFGATAALVIVLEHEPIFTTIATVADAAAPLHAEAGELSVTAAGVDGFYGGPLDALLQHHRRSHLVVCGYGLETVVHGTVRRANDRGYECLTVIDASIAHDPALLPAARSMIEMSGGIFGAVANTEATISAFTPTPFRAP